MSFPLDPDVLAYIGARERDGAPCRLAPSAVADGPVADDAEPVAAQAVVACPDTHRHHMDVMGHAC